MPRFGSLSVSAQGVRSSVFARLAEKIAAYKGPLFPLHIGDTHLLPCEPVRAIQARLLTADCYRYGPPGGIPELLDQLASKARTRNQLPFVDSDSVQVGVGATHVLYAAARAVLDQGDEVLLAAPYWPLIAGIVRLCGATPREVPLYQLLYQNPQADPYALFLAHLTPRTTALYVTSPNNPDGKVLSRWQLERIAAFAQENNLWVLSDEVYEDYCYDSDEAPVSIASLPGMADRTLTAFSFSKSHAMAGLRLGYVVGPQAVIALVRKVCNHTVYNVPVQLQQVALVALEESGGFLGEAKAAYQAARDEAVRAIHAPFFIPEGAYYLFLDLRPLLPPGTTDCMALLEQLLAHGVLLAPGDAFGQGFEGFARLCFAALPLPELREALARVGEVLDRAAPSSNSAWAATKG